MVKYGVNILISRIQNVSLTIGLLLLGLLRGWRKVRFEMGCMLPIMSRFNHSWIEELL